MATLFKNFWWLILLAGAACFFWPEIVLIFMEYATHGY